MWTRMEFALSDVSGPARVAYDPKLTLWQAGEYGVTAIAIP